MRQLLDGLPLLDGEVELLVGVIDHELRLPPLEVGLHHAVPHVLVLLEDVLQAVLLLAPVLPAEDLVQQRLLQTIWSLILIRIFPSITHDVPVRHTACEASRISR